MSSRDDERRVLDAIENQLQTEDPQLVGYFSAFGSVTPVNGRGGAARRREVDSAEGSGTRTGKHMPAVLELVLVIMASTLVAVLIALAVWWMLTALSQLGKQACHDHLGTPSHSSVFTWLPVWPCISVDHVDSARSGGRHDPQAATTVAVVFAAMWVIKNPSSARNSSGNSPTRLPRSPAEVQRDRKGRFR
jgi:hypothetical protein